MTATTAALVTALVSASVALLVAPSPWIPRGARARPDADERSALLRLRPVLVAAAFVGAWTLLGGPFGVAAGAIGAVVAWRVLGRAESPALRRRREELERDLPAAVHLLGACLAAGAATSAALETVADALPGAVADELLLVRHRLALGVDPVSVWHDLGRHPQLRPLGRSLERAQVSGASVRGAVDALASELSATSRARTDALARSVEVRAAAPLGACFLPGFLLLGVVPMVAGVFATMRVFG